MEGTGEVLSPLCRAYIYAIHGYFCEILFVVLILDEDWVFQGPLSACSLLVYGTCGMAMEGIYLQLRGDCCLLTRCTLYTGCIYLWQLGTGYLLRCLGACPWDHSHFHYNFLGLIALEHCLLWFVGALLLERLVIAPTLRLRLGPLWKPKQRPVPKFELSHD
ncbi:transmembrane protein 229B-like [Ahaetulla prasina]|uniref:transmembrane protein 229B-like n=1 Tax=Ahaetulla prasina TaxID=499056 RepID=UPI002649F8E1|nr:transmembrane protein 229B-like [Ahaetulla prasina]